MSKNNSEQLKLDTSKAVIHNVIVLVYDKSHSVSVCLLYVHNVLTKLLLHVIV